MENFKLQHKLLTLAFPEMEVSNLLEIITATPNPDTAMEILLGMYEEPVIGTCGDKNLAEKDPKFLSFNKWTNKVDYSYIEETKKSAYFPKDIDTSTITLENMDKLSCEWESSKTINFSLGTGKFQTRFDNCYLEKWNGTGR